ncbi:carboxymuconolactone decarboxylase family protein [Paenirhodobacter populi]|nr:carboxymuconolactone decarboxylase family protein [Sinirhodobacter populi]
MSEHTPDTIDRLTGGKGADLKAARGTVWAGLEASHQALFGPDAIADITPAERALVALAVSVWHADEPAASFYATAALDAGATDTDLAAARAAARAGQGGAERLAALLAHAHLLTFAPAEASPAALQSLRDAGISEDGIISASQLIAYVAHQLRAAHVLRLIGA